MQSERRDIQAVHRHLNDECGNVSSDRFPDTMSQTRARVTVPPAWQTAHGSPCNHHNGQFINGIQGGDIIAMLLVEDAH